VVHHQAVGRHRVHEAAELEHDGVEVGVDVGVVVLDAGDHQDRRTVVEKLGRLVEIGGVVLVPLDDEVGAAAQGGAPPEVQRDPADEERGVESQLRQRPGGHGRGGGLAVGPGDHHRRLAGQEQQLDHLGHGQVRQPGGQRVLELRIAAGDGVAHHHQVGRRIQVGRRVAGAHRDPLGRQKVAHGRIDVRIGTRHRVAGRPEQRRQRRHRRPADAQQVDPLHRPAHDHRGHSQSSSRQSRPASGSRR